MSEGAWTMRAMTEIEWLDGRVTKVPELALGDALGAGAVPQLVEYGLRRTASVS